MRLEVSCEDRLGLTRELLDRLVEHNIDLRGIEIDTSGIIYLNFPELEFRDFQHLMPEIRRIPGVYDVKTIPYMPSEREHHEIEALLKALPDLVFSLDSKGRVTRSQPGRPHHPGVATGRGARPVAVASWSRVLVWPLAESGRSSPRPAS
jgi:transcriptional regulator of aroF, aroG, tyrA and aromatic amino acid transport